LSYSGKVSPTCQTRAPAGDFASYCSHLGVPEQGCVTAAAAGLPLWCHERAAALFVSDAVQPRPRDGDPHRRDHRRSPLRHDLADRAAAAAEGPADRTPADSC